MRLNKVEKAVLARLQLGYNRVKRGWTQGQSVKPNDNGYSYCAVGSVTHPRKRINDPIAHKAQTFMRYVLGRGIVGWNDMPGRKKEDVLSLIDLSIMELKKNGLDRQ